ncbi:MAG: NifB/NifX family molybdenum-iron cluster-binding protein [Desulfuromonadaceae bacterium]
MTRIAISLWNKRIAPVFDVARHLWIVETSGDSIVGQSERRFASDDTQERVRRLTALKVEQLICGAITRSSCDALTERGIIVISFVAGGLEQVIQAWLFDTLKDGHLAMPGCGRGKRHGAREYPCKQLTKKHQKRSEQCQTEMDKAR